MKISRTLLTPVVVAVIGLASGGWFLQRGASQEQNVYTQARLFEEVLHYVSDRYVDEKQPASLYRMAIDGLLRELGDPHTVFLSPEDYEGLRVQTTGEYGGLGIQIAVRNGWVTVISPLPETPAERAGMQAGDRIVRVDGESTHGWTEEEAVANLRGPKGAPVDLKVARVGVDEPIPFTIVRDEIHVQSVRNPYVMDGGVGYIGLSVFSETSTQELRRQIDRLREQGMRGLILDLRANPGGLLEQSITTSDLFLDRNEAVAEIRGRKPSERQEFNASSADQYPGMPVVVLVSETSASASEILAGALQDHDRALVIGETTFGKGSVQTLFELSGGNYLKLTTARWYTPVGRSIQKPFEEPGGEVVLMESEEPVEVPEDTTDADVFRTDGGRIVYGGGGIRPDLVIRDTLSTPEQRFYRAVYGTAAANYQDVQYKFALNYGHEHPGLQPGFAVDAELLNSFYSALQQAGIDVDRELYDEAGGAVGRRLAYEISRAKWDELTARQRLNMDDPQIQVAAEMLREAAGAPGTLLALANEYVERPGIEDGSEAELSTETDARADVQPQP